MSELIEAAKAGDESRVRQLLAASPALANAANADGETPLMAALYRGHAAVAEQVADAILEGGGRLDLFAAAALGRTDALDVELVRPGQADARSYDGWTPLHLAAFFGSQAAAERLLTAGADINALSGNAMRNTPLHAAVAGGRSEVALLLIERGADVHAVDAGAHTPLHIAAESGDLAVVAALLERGGDPLAVDAEDKTPLSRAAARNQTAVVDLINVGKI